MPIYHKLVRDKIPEIIQESGKKFSSRILDETEYRQKLREKCYEELEEYMNAADATEALEELADLLEVIHSLAGSHGSSMEKLEEIRVRKAEKRGGFKEKVYLVEVED